MASWRQRARGALRGRRGGASIEEWYCIAGAKRVIYEMNAKWQQRAACRGLDAEIFYPSSDEEAEEAKAICAMCTVRQLCLEQAIAHRERDGVWGGLTERERRRLIRQRRKSA
jgi:WhiB family transcriptional regulator, redox-sensing transcriptional regulator